MTSLNQCCYNKTCLGGFQTLPDTVSDYVKVFPTSLPASKTKFCGECGHPEKENISKGELDDAMDEHAHMARENGFSCFYSYHTPRCIVWYKISQRMHRKINRNSSCRRNVINILFYLTYNNCFVPYHMTYPYAPQIIWPEPLLKRILREAVAQFEEQFRTDQKGLTLFTFASVQVQSFCCKVLSAFLFISYNIW